MTNDSQTVTLTLAFEPTGDFLKKIESYFEQNMGKGVSLDLKVDRKIVGGAIVICNNHYRDVSVGAQIEKKFPHGAI